MKSKFRIGLSLVFFMTLTTMTANVNAQSTGCETEEKTQKRIQSNGFTLQSETSPSGCNPSSCRGSKTEFGEAKVISSLRSKLLTLTKAMEASKSPKFEKRSNTTGDAMADSDDQRLETIIKEIRRIEEEVSSKTNYKPSAFLLPKNKAQRVRYLDQRIESIKKYL